MSNEELIVIGHNTFAINLYTELRKKELNIFFSPFSIYTALSMMYVGARGDTENLIRSVLSIPLEQNKYHDNFKNLMNHIEQGGSVLLLANLICIQQGYQLLKKFLGTINEKYSGEIWNLDFNNSTESCSIINAWVEKNTQGKIKKIIQTTNEKI